MGFENNKWSHKSSKIFCHNGNKYRKHTEVKYVILSVCNALLRLYVFLLPIQLDCFHLGTL